MQFDTKCFSELILTTRRDVMSKKEDVKKKERLTLDYDCKG
jgi:hypothetical protein